MGFYQTDCFLQTRPRDEWGYGREEFEQKLRAKLEPLAQKGVESGFSQPIDMRVSEMLSGVRANVAIKLFGDDFAALEELSGKIEEIVKRTPGASDVFRARLSGQGYLTVDIRSERLARYGLNNEDVNDVVETAVGGKVVTEVIEAAAASACCCAIRKARAPRPRTSSGCSSRPWAARWCRSAWSRGLPRWTARC